jgi:hypothetical protein
MIKLIHLQQTLKTWMFLNPRVEVTRSFAIMLKECGLLCTSTSEVEKG